MGLRRGRSFMKKPIIVWFQNDLRLTDHPSLDAAVKTGRPILPVYIWSPDDDHPWELGAASRWWLHHSLLAFTKNVPLVIRKGPIISTLKKLVHEVDAEAVYFHYSYSRRDAQILAGLPAEAFHGILLCPPGNFRTYQVFTPFFNALQKEAIAKPLPRPARPKWFKHRPSLSVDDLKLLPRVPWYQEFPWKPGEEGAHRALKRFLKCSAKNYAKDRDYPSITGTSRLSPHFHLGEISPRQVWHAAKKYPAFLRQIAWREFAYHLLAAFPKTPSSPFRENFRTFPWKKNKAALRLWQKGMTGFPIVDAGMRQLWHTGWMHNRVRMIAASFLVKDLLIPWQGGAQWFWDTLVDADLANNTLGWQWIAGCGADAAPYFRIFNPILQGKKFDPSGNYIRRFVPELQNLPDKFIHAPWTAPSEILQKAGVKLGVNYPRPIVDHAKARSRALEAFHRWQKKY